jgi:hypothetical protein
MKKLLVTIILIVGINFSSKAQITDTLQWLRTNIEQREHLFVHKPLQVLFDSLYDLKRGILQYIPPITKNWSRPDTIWCKDITLYFGERFGGGVVSQLHRSIPDINTHVPVIYVEFSWPVPFLRKWYSIDPDGLGSINWNPQLEAFWGRYWIRSVRIEEF